MIFRDLPDWEDRRPSDFLDEDEEADSWKSRETTEACKAMYGQWQQVVYLLNGVLPEEKEGQSAEDGFKAMVAVQIWSDVHLAAVKMLSSEVVHYVGKMENAAIIRKCAQDVALSLWSLQDDEEDGGGLEESHRQVLRAEIDKFRELFKAWLATFRKDDYEDEWGLFV
jgi:hypothetical protein